MTVPAWSWLLNSIVPVKAAAMAANARNDFSDFIGSIFYS
jgi:hypothetical protein